MNIETYSFILAISGTLIMTSFGIIGFFMSRVISDVRKNTEEIGKTKGKIELLNQKQDSDVIRMESLVQLELKIMAEKVGDLSSTVNKLIEKWDNKKYNT